MATKKEILTIKISYDRIEIGNILTAWIKSYQALVESSEKIKDTDLNTDFEIFRVKLMLRGMAIESLLKTLAISRKIKLINLDGALHKNFKKTSHNLGRLSNQLGLSLSNDETKMLVMLSDAIETGRYPVPAKPSTNKRFWVVPTYENLFYQFLQKTEDLINIESANA